MEPECTHGCTVHCRERAWGNWSSYPKYPRGRRIEHTRPPTLYLVLSVAMVEKESRGEQHVERKLIAIRRVTFLQRERAGWMR